MINNKCYHNHIAPFIKTKLIIIIIIILLLTKIIILTLEERNFPKLDQNIQLWHQIPQAFPNEIRTSHTSKTISSENTIIFLVLQMQDYSPQ